MKNAELNKKITSIKKVTDYARIEGVSIVAGKEDEEEICRIMEVIDIKTSHYEINSCKFDIVAAFSKKTGDFIYAIIFQDNQEVWKTSDYLVFQKSIENFKTN